MICLLRCNTVMRDWQNGLDIFHCAMGYGAQVATMNSKTLQSVINYFNKNQIYDCSIQYNYVYAHDISGIPIAQFINDTEITFRGIRIYTNDQMEDETVKFY